MQRVRGVIASFTAVCFLAAVVASFGIPTAAIADPAGDLAAAESELAEADSRLAAAESEVEREQQALKPVARRSERLGELAERAEARVDAVETAVRDERLGAAREIAAARADHDDQVATRDALRAAGIFALILGVLLTLGWLVLRRLGKWPLGQLPTRIALGTTASVFVAGLALVVLPAAPDPPQLSAEQLALAEAAEGDPLDPPTPELQRARAGAAPHVEAAKTAAAAEARAQRKVRSGEKAVAAAERTRRGAENRMDEAKRVVARIEREEAEEAAFREEATTIDYDQLIKDASDFKGKKVVYTGQIFQIQEFAGESIILLSVTDEGYGFWDDNIWVDYAGEIGSAEEDIITVYGKITGSKEYETQIGGSTYVPRMTARYIDE